MGRWYVYLQHLFQIFIHQGPANKLNLTLSEHNLLFFFALQLTCSKTMDEDSRGVFQHLMRSYAVWLPQQLRFSFGSSSNQVISHAEQPVLRGSGLGTVLTGFKISSKCPGQADCGGHYVFWGIKEEWKALLGFHSLTLLKLCADCANNFVVVQGLSPWPARWEQTWGGKENSTYAQGLL